MFFLSDLTKESTIFAVKDIRLSTSNFNPTSVDSEEEILRIGASILVYKARKKSADGNGYEDEVKR